MVDAGRPSTGRPGVRVDDEAVDLGVGLEEGQVGSIAAATISRGWSLLLHRRPQLRGRAARRPGCRRRRRARRGRRSAGRRRSCWCRPRRRSRPCRRRRRAGRPRSGWRRPVARGGRGGARPTRVAPVARGCVDVAAGRGRLRARCWPATSVSPPRLSCERRYRVLSVPATHPTPEVPMAAPRSPDPQGRDRRRQPHPVRAVELRVRAGVQPGHAHRDARRAGRPLRAAGRAGGRGRRRRRPQARPRLQPDPRVACSARSSSATTPAYDVQQACGTGLEAAVLVANKIALGQIESGIAGGVDTTSDAPLAVNDDLRRVLIALNSAKTLQRAAQGARGAAARASSCRRSRATPSRAPAWRWATTPRSPPRSGRSAARSRTSSPSARTRTWPPPTTAASSTTWSRPTSGLTRDQNLRPDSSMEKLATLEAGVRQGRGRHDDGGQLHAADRRRLRRPAGLRRVGRRARACRCSPTSSTRRPPPSTTCTAARAC